MLHGDPTAERGDPVDGLIGDRLAVVEEPVQALQRRLLVHALENVERAADGLVVRRMHAPGPAVLHEDADDVAELVLHLGGHVGPGLAKVLEVGRREDQHFACAVVPK